MEEIVEDDSVGQQSIYNNCRFYGNFICYIIFITLLKLSYFNYFLYIMHAKTEINATKILSLLYHSTPSCMVFKKKIKKNQ